MSEMNIVRYTIDELRRLKGRTDWARLRAEEAEGIEPELDDEEIGIEWSEARLVIPEPKKAISLRLDVDVLNHFKAQGPGYQTRINAVLRAYKNAQRPR